MLINFNEIPQANLGNGLQDTFELFCRDFLEEIGFEIIQHPNRGADGKKDLIVIEIREGVTGKSYIKWLVSCKHYSHSGKAVSQDDEPDILDRVRAHDCQGFLGFYSTIPTSSLNSKLERLKDKMEFQIYDKERIEKKLLGFSKGIKLAKRYFPNSIKNYLNNNPKPVRIFQENTTVSCEHCGKNLLNIKNGMMVFLVKHIPDTNNDFGFVESDKKDVYFSCKGICYNILNNKFENHGLFEVGWQELDDLLIPTIYLKNIIAFIHELSEKKIQSNIITKMKDLYINIFPHISRELTDIEKEKLKFLVPLWQSGLY